MFTQGWHTHTINLSRFTRLTQQSTQKHEHTLNTTKSCYRDESDTSVAPIQITCRFWFMPMIPHSKKWECSYTHPYQPSLMFLFITKVHKVTCTYIVHYATWEQTGQKWKVARWGCFFGGGCHYIPSPLQVWAKCTFDLKCIFLWSVFFPCWVSHEVIAKKDLF